MLTTTHRQTGQQVRFFLFIGIALLMLILTGCVSTTGVTYSNQTVCGTIHIELTNNQTGVTNNYEVPLGETVTIEVSPNVTYAYMVDYTTAANDAGMQCMAIHRGQINVEPGTTQIFNLTAVTPTPPAMP